MNLQNSITDVGNLLVGHAQDFEALTGCTVILAPKGAIAGVSQRGGAPGTRETDLLRPMHMVQKVHAILLAGGSAYGLDAAGGVMRWLENKKIGFKTQSAIVPIVPAAIIYDLGIGNPKIRPDAEMGFKACENASDLKPAEGNIGCGTGASVGKVLGMSQAMKAGVGTSSREIGNGAIIGAIAVVNAFGDIVDADSRKIIAGARSIKVFGSEKGSQDYFADTLQVMNSIIGRGILSIAGKHNTVLGVIATNVKLSKDEANKFAESASDGITLAVRPAFTMLDGDTVFSLSAGNKKLDLNILCAFAPLVFADAIRNAVLAAESIGDLPSIKSKY
jgi:L-aminopeptidase/D-esterase-like protein